MVWTSGVMVRIRQWNGRRTREKRLCHWVCRTGAGLGVSRQDLRNKTGRWLGNQHRRRWQDLGNSQRRARELISGPSKDTRVRFLSFNRVQSRVVTVLLTRHNTLHRHLHLMRLTDNPLCRKCGAEDETSAHILCRCEVLVPLRHAYLGSLFLEPEDIKSQTLAAIWRFSRAAGLPWVRLWDTKGWFHL
jgi:hypothetical protein